MHMDTQLDHLLQSVCAQQNAQPDDMIGLKIQFEGEMEEFGKMTMLRDNPARSLLRMISKILQSNENLAFKRWKTTVDIFHAPSAS